MKTNLGCTSTIVFLLMLLGWMFLAHIFRIPTVTQEQAAQAPHLDDFQKPILHPEQHDDHLLKITNNQLHWRSYFYWRGICSVSDAQGNTLTIITRGIPNPDVTERLIVIDVLFMIGDQPLIIIKEVKVSN